MDTNHFLDQAWNDHATDAAAVAARLAAQAEALVQQPDQLLPVAHLAHHVFGEHLGRWAEGLALLQALHRHPQADDAGRAAAARFMASLRLASGLGDDRAGLPDSERIRITALAAGSLSGHDPVRAGSLLDEAANAAEAATTAGLPDNDPAHRALAVAGNNIAAALEEAPARTEAQRALMLRAAEIGRTHWAKAGTWLETGRAEYRLSLCWLAAGDAGRARQHAQQCLVIVRANAGPEGEAPLEAFFGWEALARAERAAGDGAALARAREAAASWFQRLPAEDQAWCRSALDALG